jgi:outer membrane protein OmpA-like peptidoglycan-associated protein
MKKMTLFAILLLIVLSGHSFAQVLPGASFLRTTPGARMHAMSGIGAAGLDGIHSMYANPAVAGFMREGQWSATFTSWIADVYNASFIYGRRIRTPWSRMSRFSLGILYQGMDEFDSTDGAAAVATANDLIVSGTFGQPLTAISKGLSVGANAKYFQSNLDYFSANAFILDAGLFYRTPRFKMPLNGLGLFPQGIISTGVSMTNLGGDLEYISIGTPLPRAVRGGLSLNAGSHNGLQTQISMDYVKFRDEDSGLRMGFEISWNKIFALSGGYQKNSSLLDQATFGLSINLDNFPNPIGAFMPKTATAMRFDLATQDEKEFFSRTYRGSASHYSIGPEAFRLQWPEQNAFYEHDSLVFTWEPSRDPDLYDDVAYHLLAGRDSTKLAGLLDDMRYQNISPSRADLQEKLLVNQLVEQNSYELPNFPGGHYYWAVVAYDTDDHSRMATRQESEIGHFYIPRPDLIVESIEHEYYDLIDTTDYHGTIRFVIKNQGERDAKNINIALHDSVLSPVGNISDTTILEQNAEFVVDQLLTGEADTLTYEWRRETLGACQIAITPDQENNISELNDENNRKEQILYTVPKGTFVTAADTSMALLTSRVVVELPFINQVNFDVNDATVRDYYTKDIEAFDATLLILAQRLQKNRSLQVRLIGYADTNSEKIDSVTTAAAFNGQVNDQKKASAIVMNASLRNRLAAKTVSMPDPLFHIAFARAASVRDSLLAMNVLPQQVVIDSIKVWKKRFFSARATQTDKDMLLEERRQVDILASPAAEKILFEPTKKIDDEPVRDDILFNSRITNAAAITDAQTNFRANIDDETWRHSTSFTVEKLSNSVPWEISKFELPELEKIIGPDIAYDISLTDELGRHFHNNPDTLVFSKNFMLRQHRISFPLKFGQAQLLYSDYWNRIYTLGDSLFHNADSIRLRFEGHSCIIGNAIFNAKLSQKRALDLKSAYFTWVENNHQNKLSEINSHTDDTAKGLGENDPLKIYRLRIDPILIGDNDKSIGRQFNRRIEIIYYSPLIK